MYTLYVHMCLYVCDNATTCSSKSCFNTAATLLKRPRTPPNMSNVDYQSGDSELIMKKTRPGGQTMEEVGSFVSGYMIAEKTFMNVVYKHTVFGITFTFWICFLRSAILLEMYRFINLVCILWMTCRKQQFDLSAKAHVS